MTKHKQLVNRLVKHAVICGVVLALFVGVFFFTGSLLDSSIPDKTRAESNYQRDRTEIANLNQQLEKSGVAETRFLEIQRTRGTMNLFSDNETMKDWLRNAKTRYRLSDDFKLSLTAEQPVANPDGVEARYIIVEHPSMKLEFKGMTDAHAFAFIQDLVNSAPGFIRIESMSLSRTVDIDGVFIDKMRSGVAPELVETRIEFNWIGIKENPKAPKNAQAPAPEVL